MDYNCRELYKTVTHSKDILTYMHEACGCYLDTPAYGKLMNDLERKQIEFTELVNTIQKEKLRAADYKQDLIKWANEIVDVMWKDSNVTTEARLKSIKFLKAKI